MLDVEDRGPVLTAGRFRMRITNAGILGNAFYDVGRSSDPSFEYPAYSGIEMLNHAELWVGARDVDGGTYVSGGPMLEWRPTLAPDDRVRLADRNWIGGTRRVDDDGDGRVDEEQLNDRDDDGDGEVDEDLGIFSDQMATADYVDDRPEAISFGYATGESHHALGLSVHQEVYAWNAPGFEGVAGIRFQITNHGTRSLRDLYLGLLADLDSRRVDDRSGHRNDHLENVAWSARKFEGTSRLLLDGVVPCGSPNCPPPPTQCFTNFGSTVMSVGDGAPGTTLPVVALMPLDHTTDPLAKFLPQVAAGPYRRSFLTSAFDAEGIPGGGGPPQLDEQRYLALEGRYPGGDPTRDTDWMTLLSCGPFPSLDPGRSVEFVLALVAAPNTDSLAALMARVALMHHGVKLDLLPNASVRVDSIEYTVRETGIAGHDACIAPPSGYTFRWDPDCSSKMSAGENRVEDVPITYVSGPCIWTDTDCSACTGLHGKETDLRWLEPANVVPGPRLRLTPGDGQVLVEWDNTPEVLLSSGRAGGPRAEFLGYRVYKLSTWRNRTALLPPIQNWALLGTFGTPSGNGELPLATVTDTTVDYERILYERKLYPAGRYRIVDREVLNGFDYLYAVTTVHVTSVDVGNGTVERSIVETPLIARFDGRVTPQSAASGSAGQVTVVPNPYRGRAGWDRPAVLGDPLPRHVDFLHLPKERATIKIYTVAGDLVAQVDHDGRRGDGQASWDLISRNGQDVESGIYLFTVDSPLGHQVGKFVIIR